MRKPAYLSSRERSKLAGFFTRGQLVREVAFLIRPHNLRISLAKGAHIWIVIRWAAGFQADLEVGKTTDFVCTDSTKLGFGVPDWSRVNVFNTRIQAACRRSDELAKTAGEDKLAYFESIFADAEHRNEKDGW